MTPRNDKKRLIAGLAIAAAALFLIHRMGAHDGAGNGGRGIVSAEQLETPRMMELYTPYCPSCQEMAPVVEQLKARCREGVQVLQVDVSQTENEPFAEQYGIDAVPTFIFIDENGVETTRLVGKQQASTLQQHLATISGKRCAS